MSDQKPVEPEWVKRRRLAAIFGDVLPEGTSDDRDDRRQTGAGDRWLQEQVPPHHDASGQ